MFELLRLALVFAVMGYAAYSDYKTGEVSDKVWLFAPFCFMLSLFDLGGADYFIILMFTVSVLISCIGGLLLSVFGGENFGGADGKALMFLGLAFPLGGAFVLYPLTVFMFAGLLAGLVFLFSKKRKKHVRFLPYMFIATFLALL